MKNESYCQYCKNYNRKSKKCLKTDMFTARKSICKKLEQTKEPNKSK